MLYKLCYNRGYIFFSFLSQYPKISQSHHPPLAFKLYLQYITRDENSMPHVIRLHSVQPEIIITARDFCTFVISLCVLCALCDYQFCLFLAFSFRIRIHTTIIRFSTLLRGVNKIIIASPVFNFLNCIFSTSPETKLAGHV